ncbi:MAG: hypothetical protein HY519_02555 [Candidatus Aenigmarchaeota archaeon]|nr:hypothetical protein [Candidatus Aenigmarchaeota archaeon]
MCLASALLLIAPTTATSEQATAAVTSQTVVANQLDYQAVGQAGDASAFTQGSSTLDIENWQEVLQAILSDGMNTPRVLADFKDITITADNLKAQIAVEQPVSLAGLVLSGDMLDVKGHSFAVSGQMAGGQTLTTGAVLALFLSGNALAIAATDGGDTQISFGGSVFDNHIGGNSGRDIADFAAGTMFSTNHGLHMSVTLGAPDGIGQMGTAGIASDVGLTAAGPMLQPVAGIESMKQLALLSPIADPWAAVTSKAQNTALIDVSGTVGDTWNAMGTYA